MREHNTSISPQQPFGLTKIDFLFSIFIFDWNIRPSDMFKTSVMEIPAWMAIRHPPGYE